MEKAAPLPPSRLPTRVRSSISGQDCGPAENRSHPYVVIRELLSSASLLDLAPLAEIA
ncbi:UNVERIFIED_CONTAM: hypothetical protein Slati_4574000 [Sesamum latifolium]|uniref:Uncharacterized protein n=1 Tax=Sesamum latifolium TaxID=2727402 RepID=A0AAW2SGA9_9LAMI